MTEDVAQVGGSGRLSSESLMLLTRARLGDTEGSSPAGKNLIEVYPNMVEFLQQHPESFDEKVRHFCLSLCFL